MKSLEQRIAKIEERNKKVEADKAWEVSVTREIFIAVCTYFVVGLFLSVIQIQHPWLNSIVPTIGFILSTLTLPIIKKNWIKKFYDN